MKYTLVASTDSQKRTQTIIAKSLLGAKMIATSTHDAGWSLAIYLIDTDTSIAHPITSKIGGGKWKN